jgi:hypothetical protein
VGGELKNTKTRNRYAIDMSKLPSFHEVGGMAGLWEKRRRQSASE